MKKTGPVKRSDISQLRLAFGDDRARSKEDRALVRCTGCGRPFAVPRWFLDQSLNLRFCSKRCRKVWENVGDDIGENVRTEGRPEHRGGNWRVQASRARERDGFRCQVCGVTEEALGRRLDVHHRIPARAYQDASESNQLANLVAVCPACHKRLEESGRAELPLFEGVRHPGQRIEFHRGA